MIINRKCIKCKQTGTVEGKVEKTKNGKKMFRGQCPNCGTTICQFMAQDTPEG